MNSKLFSHLAVITLLAFLPITAEAQQDANLANTYLQSAANYERAAQQTTDPARRNEYLQQATALREQARQLGSGTGGGGPSQDFDAQRRRNADQQRQMEQSRAELQRLQQQMKTASQQQQSIVKGANSRVNQFNQQRDSINGAFNQLGNILQQQMAEAAAEKKAQRAQDEYDRKMAEFERKEEKLQAQLEKQQEEFARQQSETPRSEGSTPRENRGTLPPQESNLDRALRESDQRTANTVKDLEAQQRAFVPADSGSAPAVEAEPQAPLFGSLSSFLDNPTPNPFSPPPVIGRESYGDSLFDRDATGIRDTAHAARPVAQEYLGYAKETGRTLFGEMVEQLKRNEPLDVKAAAKSGIAARLDSINNAVKDAVKDATDDGLRWLFRQLPPGNPALSEEYYNVLLSPKTRMWGPGAGERVGNFSDKSYGERMKKDWEDPLFGPQ